MLVAVEPKCPQCLHFQRLLKEQIFSCLLPVAVVYQGHRSGLSLLLSISNTYVKIIPIVSLFNCQELISFFFDIFKNFFDLFDYFIQCCMHLLTGRITLSL